MHSKLFRNIFHPRDLRTSTTSQIQSTSTHHHQGESLTHNNAPISDHLTMRTLLITATNTTSTTPLTPPHHHTLLIKPHHNPPQPPQHPQQQKQQTPPKPKPTSISPPTPTIPTPNTFSLILSSFQENPSEETNETSISHYAHLASSLVFEGRFDDFGAFVEGIKGNGGLREVGFGGFLDLGMVLGGVVRGMKEGRAKGVVGVLRGFGELGVDLGGLFDGDGLGLVGEECRRMMRDGKQVEGVVEVMEVLAGFEFSIRKLVKPNDIFARCIDKRIPDIAVRYACLLPHAHILVCTMIKEFGRRKDLISALTAFEASEQKIGENNMFVYRSIIDVCGLCGDYFRSRSIYEDLLARKVIPNIYVFNSLMNVNAHDVNYNVKVYKKMKNLGVIPDMASYNILLKSCCLAGRVDLAQDIYKEVKQLESKGALKLDLFTFSTIIKIYADAKLWRMALGIKEEMVSAGVTLNTVTWSSLINACAKAGLVDQANQLFEEMLLAGCEPNSQCVNILLNACVEASQYDRAFRVFETWKDNGSQKTSGESSGCDTLAVEQKAEDNETVMPYKSSPSRHFSLAKGIPFRPETATYNILMKACGTDYFRAVALFNEMKSLGLSSNQVSWSTLINICGAAGDVDRVLELLKAMRVGGIIPDVVAYTNAMQVCVECKQLKPAFRLFAEMKKNGIQPNLVTYNTLLRARDRYGSLDQVQQCLAIYLEMRKAGFRSNDYYLKQLIGEWCEGVLQKNNNYIKGQFKLHGRVDSYGKKNLLLERVAMHLQKSTEESILIDIRGLTKVEARIVVLAVLRMIKENHSKGLPIKDDLLITFGKEVGPLMRDTITNLLSYELRLDVTLVESIIEPDMSTESTQPHHDSISKLSLKRSKSLDKREKASTRPVFLQRMLVTKKSLYQWLQRKQGAVTGY